MGKFYKLGCFLFFTTLMLVKIAALHVYSHDETEPQGIETCQYCEVALEAQNTPLALHAPSSGTVSPEFFDERVRILDAQDNPVLNGISRGYHCRPPPATV